MIDERKSSGHRSSMNSYVRVRLYEHEHVYRSFSFGLVFLSLSLPSLAIFIQSLFSPVEHNARRCFQMHLFSPFFSPRRCAAFVSYSRYGSAARAKVSRTMQ